ncbi:MAG: gamma-glutamyltransferase [Acidobacteria bacterium]|nr:gamma-glutamyltransferase [Acidobacteriota bacterium]
MPQRAAAGTFGADRPAGEAAAGRSAVLARQGMVATSQPLAAQAGLRALEQGGNAFDAAVVTAAMLAVVEPMMTGPGGDVFALGWSAHDQKLFGLNGSGFSPAGVNRSFFEKRNLERVPTTGPFSVTVPGAVDAWAALLEAHGRWSLAQALAPAIEYAREGFPVSEIIGADWEKGGPPHAGNEAFRRTFLKMDGRGYRHGEVFRNPDLARTFEAVAAGGRDAFYRGEIAEKIALEMERLGWPLTLEDLAFQRSDWVKPISTDYKGYCICELPPNGQGLAALEMLNILEGYDLRGMGRNSAEYLHLLIEAKKLAYADLAAWLADPEQARLPVDTLISKEYAARQRARIDPGRAAQSVTTGVDIGSADTVYLTAVDKDRNVVSFINSIFHNFGSGVVVPGTGFALQNRGALFSLQPGHPNEIAPRKRPYHTIIPAMALRDGRPWMSFGVMGGDMQPQGHVQVLLNRIEFGLNVQEAGEAARFRHNPDTGVAVESGIGATVVQQLARLGHDLRWAPGSFGGYQAIEIDWERGVLWGGTDPRKDGAVAAY